MADDFDDFPRALRDDLKSLHELGFAVPSKLDDAILNRARARLSRRRLLHWAGAAAAAACLIIVARISLHQPPHRVDIVDALKLAHQIQSGGGRDVNGDGVIDQRDVDALAMTAVRLDDGGVQ